MNELSDKLSRVEAVDTGKGIQSFLHLVCEILGNPLAMFDMEYRLMAYTDVVTDDPFWNELVTDGVFSRQTQVLFMEMGFIDDVANSKTVAYLTNERLRYNRILGKLYNENNVQVANLILVACNRPFDEDDLAVFEAVCNIISSKIINNGFYQTYGNIHNETYVKKLINGEISDAVDKALHSGQIAVIYNKFKSDIRLIVADIGAAGFDKHSKLAHFRDLFRRTESSFEYAVYKDCVIIIINSSKEEFDAERDLGKIYGLFVQNNIYCGVSSCFDNLYELRKYYLDAAEALSLGLSEKPEGRLFFVKK